MSEVPMTSPPATREELDTISLELREGLTRDRDERVGHFIRLEAKMDARFQEVMNTLSNFMERNSDMNARVKSLEKASEDCQTIQRVQAEALSSKVGQEQHAALASKSDRNWGVILTLCSGVMLYLITTLITAARGGMK